MTEVEGQPERIERLPQDGTERGLMEVASDLGCHGRPKEAAGVCCPANYENMRARNC
jgi:hypothetical protein